MARSVRWQCSFKSKDNISCVVQIYEEGWSGGITQLIPAPNPFYYEEDDSDDMTTLVRPRTGYLSVIEEHYGDLADLFTTSALQHYVTFHYNSVLDFTGYLQVQTFQNKVNPGPNVLEFPVVSVLGLLDSFNFAIPTDNALPATNIKIGALLKDIWNTMQASWSCVVAPYESSSVFFAGHETSRLVCCPFNTDYDRSIYNTTDVFNPITFADFMEGLCASYGFMVYETPTELTFRLIGYGGQYAYVNKGVIDAVDGNNTWVNPIVVPNGTSQYLISDKYEWTDNDATVENIMPVHEMNFDFEGEFLGKTAFSFDRMKAVRIQNNIAFMKTGTPELVNTGYLLEGNTWYSQQQTRQFTSFGAWPMAYTDQGSKKEAIFIQPDPSWSTTHDLFRMVFYRRPSVNDFYVNIDYRWGDDYREQATEGDWNTYYHIEYSIMGANGKFYNNSDTPVWQDTEVFFGTVNSLSGGVHVENAPDGPITLHFRLWGTTGSNPKKMASIWDVNIGVQDEPLSEFMFDVNAPVPLYSSQGGEGEVTLDRKFVVGGKKNENMCIGTYNISTVPSYVLFSQQRMVACYRKTAKGADSSYRPLLGFLKDAQDITWRQIALRFTPVDDEVQLTLHRILPTS